MTLEQAVQNIEFVLAQFKGTLAEHKSLQDALTLVKEKCFSKQEPTPASKEVEIHG